MQRFPINLRHSRADQAFTVHRQPGCHHAHHHPDTRLWTEDASWTDIEKRARGDLLSTCRNCWGDEKPETDKKLRALLIS